MMIIMIVLTFRDYRNDNVKRVETFIGEGSTLVEAIEAANKKAKDYANKWDLNKIVY